jgi:hypothetical protein
VQLGFGRLAFRAVWTMGAGWLVLSRMAFASRDCPSQAGSAIDTASILSNHAVAKHDEPLERRVWVALYSSRGAHIGVLTVRKRL